MQIVSEATTAGTQDDRAAELARADDRANRIDRSLVLPRFAVVPGPIAVQVIAVFDDAARKSGRGPRTGPTEARTDEADDLFALRAHAFGHGLESGARSR
jgi:hypothetical protein